MTINGSALKALSDVSPLDSTGTKVAGNLYSECDR